MAAPPEHARVLRLDGLAGIEALHATFVRYRYALHTHDAHTIALVDRGAATFALEGRRYVAPQGSLFVIPPGRAHTGESAARAGYTYRVLYVSPDLLIEGLEQPRRAAAPEAGCDVVVSAPGLVPSLDRIHRRFAAQRPWLRGDELVWSGLAAVAARLLDTTTHPVRIDHRAVGRAAAYLQDRWDHAVSLAELADEAGINPYRLVRLFRRHIGLAPSAYQRQLRIDRAKRLLRQGVPPAEVALACGFYDQPHLNRHFRRLTGVTPAAYARGR